MRVKWNTYEPPVPVDLDDREGGSLVEIYNANDELCEVRKTQIIGHRDRDQEFNRVYIWVDGALKGTTLGMVWPIVVVPNFLIEVRSSENTILTPIGHVINGNTIRIRVRY